MPTQPTSPALSAPGFGSVLFADPELPVAAEPPAHVVDLNLDQLIGSILAGRQEYDLAGYFFTPLPGPAAVAYRHQVFRDLQQPPVAGCLARFGQDMVEVRGHLGRSGRARFPLQRQAWHLTAALAYAAAVRRLHDGLADLPLTSAGLTGFRQFLDHHLTSAGFEQLAGQADQVRGQLDAVRYRLRVHGDRVEVSLPHDDEPDYAAEILATFARFRQGPVKSYRSTLGFYEDMNHVEEAIASRVATLVPQPFAALADFSTRHRHFTHQVITRFERESQFYLAYAGFAARMHAAGLPMCFPEISGTRTPLHVSGGWDAALADKLTADRRPVILNDAQLTGAERIWVVTGPNQGGKTTYARMIGQLHYLAALGVPIPGRQARLPLCDQIFTHFERGENSHDLTGKLDDDLIRIRDILTAARPASLLILNEIFTSTSLADAVWLATRVLRQVAALDCLCVCVTFLDELTTLGPSTVSLVSTVDPADPARRTFTIARRPADGRAYADAIAGRYRLTGADLADRLPT